jgi:hypothetical protein
MMVNGIVVDHVIASDHPFKISPLLDACREQGVVTEFLTMEEV